MRMSFQISKSLLYIKRRRCVLSSGMGASTGVSAQWQAGGRAGGALALPLTSAGDHLRVIVSAQAGTWKDGQHGLLHSFQRGKTRIVSFTSQGPWRRSYPCLTSKRINGTRPGAPPLGGRCSHSLTLSGLHTCLLPTFSWD